MKRPIVFITIFLCFGIYANYYFQSITSMVMISVGVFLFNTYLYVVHKSKFIFLLYVFFIIGFCISKDDKSIDLDKSYYVSGIIKDIESTSYSNNVLIDVDNIDNEKSNINIMLITHRNDLEIGDNISFNQKLYKIQKEENKNTYLKYRSRNIEYKAYCEDVYISGKTKNIIYYGNLLRNQISSVYDEILPTDESNIAKALVLGRKDGLDSDIISTYRKGGIIHILSLSGLHIAILSTFLMYILDFFIKGKIKNLVVIIFLIFYLILTGCNISTIRAVIMVCCILIAPFFKRKNDTISTICFSAILILIFMPYNLLTLSFILTYSSVLSIVLLSDKVQSALNNIINKSNNKFLLLLTDDEVAIISPFISVSIVMNMVLVYYFYYFYPYSIFVNIAITLLVSPLIILSLACGVIGLFNLSIASFIGATVYYILEFFEYVCKLFESLPFSEILIGKPSIVFIILYFIIVYIIFFKNKNKFKNIFYCITLMSIVIIINAKFICIQIFKDNMETVMIYDNEVVLLDAETDYFYKNKNFALENGDDKIDIIVTDSVDNVKYFNNLDMIDTIYICSDNPLVYSLDGMEIYEVSENEKFIIDENEYFINSNNVYMQNNNFSFANIKNENLIFQTNVQNNVHSDDGYDIIISNGDNVEKINNSHNDNQILFFGKRISIR